MQNKMKCLFIVCIFVLSLLNAAGISCADRGNKTYTERIAGEDRIETACKIAENGWNQSDVVILTRSDTFPDSLSGGPLAAQLEAPILLTESNNLNPKTLQTIQTLKPEKVIILGGIAAISQVIEDQLRRSYLVERIGGADRFETSALIAGKVNSEGYGILTTGFNWPDAVSSAPFAASIGAPILITGYDSIPEGIKKVIETKNLKIYILGGTTAVSSNIEKELKNEGRFIERLGGKDRYETSVIIAKKFASIMYFQKEAVKSVIIARGDNFPDSICVGPFAASIGAPILLTNPAAIPSSTSDFLGKNMLNKVYIVGGTSAVSASVEGNINKMIQAKFSIHGIWLWPSYVYEIDASELTRSGIDHLFLLVRGGSGNIYTTQLKALVDKVAGSGIKIHAWIVCFKDKDKWVDPENETFRNQLIGIIANITRNYKIDGIHLDYVRYPGTAYKYPDGTDTINSFVRDVYAKVKSAKPNIAISAAVMPECDKNVYYYGQDYEKLAEYLDFIVPMTYKGNYKQNTAWIGSVTKYIVGKARGEVLAGILTYRSDENPTPLPLTELRQDIKTAMDNGATGYVLFRYGLIHTDFFKIYSKAEIL